MGRGKKWSIRNMLNTACFSYCSIPSCCHLPQLPVIQATDRHGNSSRSHMVQLPIPDLQLFKIVFVCQPAICWFGFLGFFLLFFLNAEMNHSSFPEGEIMSFLFGCTKYKFQAGHWSQCCFHYFISLVTASPWAFSIPGEYMVWTRMSSLLLYDDGWKQYDPYSVSERRKYFCQFCWSVIFSYIFLFIHFLKFVYFTFFSRNELCIHVMPSTVALWTLGTTEHFLMYAYTHIYERDINTIIFLKVLESAFLWYWIIQNICNRKKKNPNPKLFPAFQCSFKKCLAFVFAVIVRWKLFMLLCISGILGEKTCY